MLGEGKLCRFELHHPMSLGDLLAALFRGKPRKMRTEDRTTFAALPETPEPAETEHAAPNGEGRGVTAARTQAD